MLTYSRWHLLAFVNPSLCSSSGFSSHLSDLCWLCHSLDSQLKANRSPLPSVVDCLSASLFTNWPSGFSQTWLSSSTSALVWDLELRPFFGFRAKTDEEIVCLARTPRSVTPNQNQKTQTALSYNWTMTVQIKNNKFSNKSRSSVTSLSCAWSWHKPCRFLVVLGYCKTQPWLFNSVFFSISLCSWFFRLWY